MDSLQIHLLRKESLPLLFFLFLFIFFNFTYEYLKYKELTNEEIYSSNFEIINIYDKKEFYVLKLQNSDFSFYTSINKKYDFKKLSTIDITFLTKNITFFSFLKGFYSKTIYYEKPKEQDTLKTSIYKHIISSHKDKQIQELFSALFLAVPISKEYRDIYTNFSISHLIAISGFHLSIILFIFYWFINLFYSYLHKKYFIYRNKKFDILVMCSFILFVYLYLIGFVPSFLRSFIMFIFSVIFLRSNLKLISFETLILVLLVIIAFFPKYLFSISLWFSITGVFYIFLYLKYFSSLQKIIGLLFFNFWIFFAFNPIVHFFFSNTSLEQLFSPFLTLLFILFYPLELFLHLVNSSVFLDNYIMNFLEINPIIYSFHTNYLFLGVYILFSFLSIFGKKYFIIFNILLVIFNIIIF